MNKTNYINKMNLILNNPTGFQKLDKVRDINVKTKITD